MKTYTPQVALVELYGAMTSNTSYKTALLGDTLRPNAAVTRFSLALSSHGEIAIFLSMVAMPASLVVK